MEEPKKEEIKKTKVKVPKAKKYEDLPEIPDYERPELEIYEESAFDPSKVSRAVDEPLKQSEKPVESKVEVAEPAKNGLPKVCFCFLYALSMNNHNHWVTPFWFFEHLFSIKTCSINILDICQTILNV